VSGVKLRPSRHSCAEESSCRCVRVGGPASASRGSFSTPDERSRGAGRRVVRRGAGARGWPAAERANGTQRFDSRRGAGFRYVTALDQREDSRSPGPLQLSVASVGGRAIVVARAVDFGDDVPMTGGAGPERGGVLHVVDWGAWRSPIRAGTSALGLRVAICFLGASAVEDAAVASPRVAASDASAGRAPRGGGGRSSHDTRRSGEGRWTGGGTDVRWEGWAAGDEGVGVGSEAGRSATTRPNARSQPR
jgi:hypothetical protein